MDLNIAGGWLPDADAAMLLALVSAADGGQLDEVPVGAVVQDQAGWIVAASANRTLHATDPTGHAEVVALRTAATRVGNHRLTTHQLIVTLEPCALCRAAAAEARVGPVLFGALRSGAPAPPVQHSGVVHLPSRDLATRMLKFFFELKREIWLNRNTVDLALENSPGFAER